MRDKKITILIVLSVFAAISLFYGISASARRGAPGGHKTAERGLGRAPSPEPSFLPRRAKRSRFTFWKRNPFTPGEGSPKVYQGLDLDGIIWDEKNPLAIINGRIVKINDKVGDKLVVDIKRDRVILSDGVNNLELKL